MFDNFLLNLEKIPELYEWLGQSSIKWIINLVSNLLLAHWTHCIIGIEPKIEKIISNEKSNQVLIENEFIHLHNHSQYSVLQATSSIEKIIDKRTGRVEITDELGLNSDYLEALGFAWLAKERISNKTFNLSKVTGSQGPVSVGEIFLP